MKKHLLALAIAAIPASAVLAASANTINFHGEVTDQTCEVAINGATANPTVLLPTVSSSKLASAGSTAGLTTFAVGVSGCTAPTTAAQSIKTVFMGNQTTTAGNLDNVGTAKGVALQLLDPSAPSSPFNLSGAEGYAATGLSLGVGQTSASYDFAVQYISEQGGVAPGSVKGSVQYQVSYR
ncbi:fimbrial protein [Burkholderia guangdongensis]|uniref:fimbrial protein n=1 Tax=Burkholderia guangdongensis TaxID=1792500 RepID=UPI0015C6EE61|nr:fimbrial protein [Burkholderia guangdongensis]